MKQSFGEFLTQKRKSKNLTQKALAEKLFVTESAVSKWEKNVARPDISLLPELCKILDATEHELITASEDNVLSKTKKDARKWNNLSKTWNYFFNISYIITIITCFIVNICVSQSLTWFWIVLLSVMLSASFTTFPQYIKKNKVTTISLIQLLLLILLLKICNDFSSGSWFFLTSYSIVNLFLIIFLPIYIAKNPFPKIIKDHNALISVVFDYLLLGSLLFVIEKYTNTLFAWEFAVPLLSYLFGFIILIVLIIRYLKIKNQFKISLILFGSVIFLIGSYELVSKLLVESFDLTIGVLEAPNFLVWNGDEIGNNVIGIILLLLLSLGVIFYIIGIKKNKNQQK